MTALRVAVGWFWSVVWSVTGVHNTAYRCIKTPWECTTTDSHAPLKGDSVGSGFESPATHKDATTSKIMGLDTASP